MILTTKKQRPFCRSVRLMNEYTVDLPLWPTGERTGSDDAFVRDVMSRLTHRLQKSVRAVARRFQAHFNWDSGWDDPAIEVMHCRHMHSTFRRLKEQLGPEWEVTMDLWECSAEVQRNVELGLLRPPQTA
ncbi:hypothetical protein ACHAXT_005199 [Thalassiosira profunda]